MKERAGLAGDDSAHDAELRRLIKSATHTIEARTGRQLITASYVLALDFFPPHILVPLGRLQSVDQIEYVDAAGQAQTLDAGEYFHTTIMEPAEIYPTGSWPATMKRAEAVKVTFTCGYGDSQEDVPPGLRRAIVEEVYNLFDPADANPNAVQALIYEHSLGDEFHVYG